MEERTAAPIAKYAGRLKEEPPARLFDEIMKLLFSGYARRCLDQFHTLGIDTPIHPLLDALQQASRGGRPNMVTASLKNTDERLRADKSVSVARPRRPDVGTAQRLLAKTHGTRRKKPLLR